MQRYKNKGLFSYDIDNSNYIIRSSIFENLKETAIKIRSTDYELNITLYNSTLYLNESIHLSKCLFKECNSRNGYGAIEFIDESHTNSLSLFKCRFVECDGSYGGIGFTGDTFTANISCFHNNTASFINVTSANYVKIYGSSFSSRKIYIHALTMTSQKINIYTCNFTINSCGEHLLDTESSKLRLVGSYFQKTNANTIINANNSLTLISQSVFSDIDVAVLIKSPSTVIISNSNFSYIKGVLANVSDHDIVFQDVSIDEMYEVQGHLVNVSLLKREIVNRSTHLPDICIEYDYEKGVNPNWKNTPFRITAPMIVFLIFSAFCIFIYFVLNKFITKRLKPIEILDDTDSDWTLDMDKNNVSNSSDDIVLDPGKDDINYVPTIDGK